MLTVNLCFDEEKNRVVESSNIFSKPAYLRLSGNRSDG